MNGVLCCWKKDPEFPEEGLKLATVKGRTKFRHVVILLFPPRPPFTKERAFRFPLSDVGPGAPEIEEGTIYELRSERALWGHLGKPPIRYVAQDVLQMNAVVVGQQADQTVEIRKKRGGFLTVRRSHWMSVFSARNPQDDLDAYYADAGIKPPTKKSNRTEQLALEHLGRESREGTPEFYIGLLAERFLKFSIDEQNSLLAGLSYFVAQGQQYQLQQQYQQQQQYQPYQQQPPAQPQQYQQPYQQQPPAQQQQEFYNTPPPDDRRDMVSPSLLFVNTG